MLHAPGVTSVRARRKQQGTAWELARQRFRPEDVSDAQSLVNLAKLVPAVAIFWALFDQHGSSWVLQARDMTLTLGSLSIQPSQMQALNPLLVMLVLPLFRSLMLPGLHMLGIRTTALRLMSCGMVLASLSFMVITVIQAMVDTGGKPHVLWQLPAYVILTLSEVLVSVTGLEFAYSQAPAELRSTVMSIWMLTTFLGNALDSVVTAVNLFGGAAFFAFFAVLMLAVALIFIWLASGYELRGTGFVVEAGMACSEGRLGSKRHLSDEDEDAGVQV